MWKSLIKLFWKKNAKVDAKRIAAQTPTPGITVHEDIPYKAGSQSEYHFLDVYRPEGDARLPVIFDIHGGGWMYGKKNINKYFGMSLAARGFVVVSLSYRLAPEAYVPEQVRDIFDALHWLKDNVADYGGDVGEFFVTGDSAGGHLALITTFCENDPAYTARFGVVKTGLNICALGLTCAAIDLEVFHKKPTLSLVRSYFSIFLGKGYRESAYRPFISFYAKAGDPLLPPVFLNSSEQDFIGSQTKKFAALLEKEGRDYALCFRKRQRNPKLPHVYNVTHPHYKESMQTNDAMCDFFKKHR